MVAAIFVAEDGPYISMTGVDAWPARRDARQYAGPYPVIAHPPCERWGRYWGGGPSAKVKRVKGDDDGCFEAAFNSVIAWGGVLEHPEGSHAWAAFGILRPNPNGGWTWDAKWAAWVCQVEQGHYGHPARKKTWLFYRGPNKPKELIWGPSTGRRLDEGFHSAEERRRAREAGQKPIKRLSKKENIHTPLAFAQALVELI